MIKNINFKNPLQFRGLNDFFRFATEREAERAVGAMNRQRLDGRTLEVALY
jgi:hypothetical protein